MEPALLDSEPSGTIPACHTSSRIQEEKFTQHFKHSIAILNATNKGKVKWSFTRFWVR
jgi:hypothetical protein